MPKEDDVIAKRAWFNYAVDMSLFVTGLVLVISSLMIWVVLQKGYSPSWLTWIAIHKWSGLALFVEALVHLVLHRKWLLAMTRKALKRRAD